MRNLLFLLLAFSFPALAQKDRVSQIFIQPKIMIVGTAGLGIGIGPFADTHTFGITGSLGAYQKVTDNIRIGLVLDENYFLGKKLMNAGGRYDPENFLRLLTSVLVRIPNSTVILGGHTGVSNATSGGFSNTAFTYGGSVGIPILSNIPILGTLFKHRDATAIKAELLLFISPTMVSPGDSDR